VNDSGESLGSRLDRIRAAIANAADRADRDPSEVKIVAAAKRVPAGVVRRAVDAGIDAVGHNYVQELSAMRRELDDLALRWHYIGTLQTGSATRVADVSDVVETVAGERAVRRLAGRAARAGRHVDVLIEVDFTDGRAGATPENVPPLIDVVTPLDGIAVRGLMTVAPLTGSAEEARPFFRRLRELRERVRDRHPEVLDLSMGMSLDYPVAVEEGATMVRIGTALFGPRD
jgi:pyridoxal phosphate enzyme (YggS family)